MKKMMRNIYAVFCGALLLGMVVYFLKSQEKDYDALMRQAYKKKNDFISLSVFDGIYEVSIPNSEMNLRGLGIDTDNNGIRDDIDIWINRMSYGFNERMAMRQYARVQQMIQKTCLNHLRPEFQDIMELEQSRACLDMISHYERNGESFGTKMLDIIIPNTEFRKKCYHFNKVNLPNETITLKSLATNCHFEVKNPKIILDVVALLKKSSSR